MTSPVGEDDLMAWIDGRLPPERQAVVDAYLAERPAVAARLARQADQARALSDALAPIAAEPVLASMRLANLRPRRAPPMWRQALAASLLLGVGFGGGWLEARRGMPPQAGIGALADEATESYRVFAADGVRPAELGPAQRALLVSWGSARLGSRVSIPALDRIGYRFAGGRMIATPHGPALLLLYRGAAHGTLALLTRPMEVDKTAALDATSREGLGRMSWAVDGVGFSLVGPDEPALLNRAVHEVRDQLAST